MKLKKNSRLMKFYKMFNMELHHDLLYGKVGVCALFWRTVWTVVTVVAFAALVCVAVWCLLNPVLVALRLVDMSVYTFTGVAFMLLTAIGIVWKWLVECVRTIDQTGAETEPGLVRSFIKAKKEKFCPTVEIID